MTRDRTLAAGGRSGAPAPVSRCEDSGPSPTGPLRGVERPVGIREHGLQRRRSVAPRYRDTDRRGNPALHPAHRNRLLDRRYEAVGEQLEPILVHRPLDKGDELVAADPREIIPRTELAQKPP